MSFNTAKTGLNVVTYEKYIIPEILFLEYKKKNNIRSTHNNENKKKIIFNIEKKNNNKYKNMKAKKIVQERMA